MAARKKLQHDQRTRERIQTSQLVNRLIQHALAKPELDEITNTYVTKDLMTQSQVTAALGLMKKILPDLSAVELTGEIEHRDSREITESDLYDIAANGSARASRPKNGEKEPDSVH